MHGTVVYKTEYYYVVMPWLIILQVNLQYIVKLAMHVHSYIHISYVYIILYSS